MELGNGGAKVRVDARPADAPRGAFNQSVQETADASGRAVLRRLPRGAWVVRKDGSRDERRVEVNSDTTLTW